MSVRDRILPVVDRARAKIAQLGLRRYRVIIRRRTWAGRTVGDTAGQNSGFTNTDLELAPTPKVELLSPAGAQLAGIIPSGGSIEDRYFKISGITPQYSTPTAKLAEYQEILRRSMKALGCSPMEAAERLFEQAPELKATPMTSNNLKAVWGNATDVWAVGDRGTILHRTSSGWAPETTAVNLGLLAVGGDAGGGVWAVGSAGTILKRSSTCSFDDPNSKFDNCFFAQ
jgi:hypothetical protein